MIYEKQTLQQLMKQAKRMYKLIFTTASFFTIFGMFPNTTFFLQLTGSLIGAIGILGMLFALDKITENISLKSLNTLSFGLLFGTLLGYGINALFEGLTNSSAAIDQGLFQLIRGCIYFFTLYLGVTVTLKHSNELFLTIPFIKLEARKNQQRDILADSSILTDPRIIDLASSGLLDQRFIIPRCVIRSLYEILEAENHTEKTKARLSLDVIRQLEELPHLGLRIVETDCPQIKELKKRIVRIAVMENANILTAEINQLDIPITDGVRLIHIDQLAKGVKTLAQSGEVIQIKVQRFGKEPKQGVGYQEDGTMVVINGGADFIGEQIKAQVLSVKHTASGRMIFSNAIEEEHATLPSNYFAL